MTWSNSNPHFLMMLPGNLSLRFRSKSRGRTDSVTHLWEEGMGAHSCHHSVVSVEIYKQMGIHIPSLRCGDLFLSCKNLLTKWWVSLWHCFVSQQGLMSLCLTWICSFIIKNKHELLSFLPPPPKYCHHRLHSTMFSSCAAGDSTQDFLRAGKARSISHPYGSIFIHCF